MNFFRADTEEEFRLIKEFCKAHNMAAPSLNSLTFFAAEEKKSNEIKGCIALEREFNVKSLVSSSPLITMRLISMVEGNILSSDISHINFVCKPELQVFYEKLGAEKVFNNSIFMQKWYL